MPNVQRSLEDIGPSNGFKGKMNESICSRKSEEKKQLTWQSSHHFKTSAFSTLLGITISFDHTKGHCEFGDMLELSF